METKENLIEFSELYSQGGLKKADKDELTNRVDDSSESSKPALPIASLLPTLLLDEEGKIPLGISVFIFLTVLACIPNLILESIAKAIYQIWTVFKSKIKRGIITDT